MGHFFLKESPELKDFAFDFDADKPWLEGEVGDLVGVQVFPQLEVHPQELWVRVVVVELNPGLVDVQRAAGVVKQPARLMAFTLVVRIQLCKKPYLYRYSTLTSRIEGCL